MSKLITDNLATWSAAITAKSSGAGRASNKGAYGIQKLRELILELAVRGQLVPQDPADEPASELLKKIRAEKDKQIKAGKIKKVKPLPEIEDDELLFELPNGWCFSRLGDVMNVLNGRAYKKHEMLSEGVPILRVGNLFTSNEWYYSDLELEPEKYIDKGDLIYAWSASFGPFIWQGERVIYHYHIWKMEFFSPSDVDKYFFKNYLEAVSASIKASGNGIAMMHMTKERMEKLLLPIPPLPEQRRIVAKIDELMALCDQLEAEQANSAATHEQLVNTLLDSLASGDSFTATWATISQHFDLLFTTPASIDKLKQTLLQLAVMGKLVPQNPADEPASELLKKIRAEKDKLIKVGKIRKDKPLPEITEEEKPFDLPKGWEWVRLGEVVTIRGGKRVANGYQLLTKPTKFIYVRVSDMKDGSIDDSDLRYIDNKMQAQISQYIITRDDIYMTIVGATIGKCGLVPDKFDGMNLTENAARLTPHVVSKYYLYKILYSDFSQNQFIEKTKQVGVQKMALNRLSNTLIPIPPLAEQHRIVAKVDELMALCDQLKARLEAAAEQQRLLADVIVQGTVG